MWHQKSTKTQNQAPGTREHGLFPSFAKRSWEVHRQHESASQDPALSQYDDSFWDKILQTPSEEAFGHDPFYDNGLRLFSTAPVEQVCGHMGSGLCLEKLPSPANLMGKKKKKGGAQRGDAAERHVTAVAQHITQLRRKQSLIDRLKVDKWWGSSVVMRSEEGCVGAEGEQTEAEGEIHTHLTDNIFSHEYVDGGCEQLLDLAPGGNPMMSFVVGGTAHREVPRKLERPTMSHNEFWGIGYNTEE